LVALIAALRRLHPNCGATAQAVLDSLPDPAAEARRVISVLINDILETLPEPLALVLDDLEVVQGPVVYAALEHLLDRLPPQMHLALASRRDPPLPLARLRARGQIVELRLVDLRFGLEEARDFLSQELKPAPSPATVALLQERTEGWPAGLRLLVGSLERIPSPAGRAAFIERLAQTDRFASDFLAEEVLNRQEAELQTFLCNLDPGGTHPSAVPRGDRTGRRLSDPGHGVPAQLVCDAVGRRRGHVPLPLLVCRIFGTRITPPAAGTGG
jgi:LuxR family maltose regulon positive regulatory protein